MKTNYENYWVYHIPGFRIDKQKGHFFILATNRTCNAQNKLFIMVTKKSKCIELNLTKYISLCY
jgi:hypothetical protein